jgi:hypothetical protein
MTITRRVRSGDALATAFMTALTAVLALFTALSMTLLLLDRVV